MMLIACYISFPFFKIKYFETLTSLKLIYHYLLIPILCFATLGTIIVYMKYLRLLNPTTNSKVKVVFQDLFSTVFLTGIVSVVLTGMTVSTIVTTNVYCGKSRKIDISAKVLNYTTSKTKFGRTTHQIDFINPYDGKNITLEVYKKYEVGELFKKDMKIGYWGQLYSKN